MCGFLWEVSISWAHQAFHWLLCQCVTEVATGRSEVPYGNLQSLRVQVYGMPPSIPFHSPLLYSQQQLQQILANLEKIVFLKVGSPVSG